MLPQAWLWFRRPCPHPSVALSGLRCSQLACADDDDGRREEPAGHDQPAGGGARGRGVDARRRWERACPRPARTQPATHPQPPAAWPRAALAKPSRRRPCLQGALQQPTRGVHHHPARRRLQQPPGEEPRRVRERPMKRRAARRVLQHACCCSAPCERGGGENLWGRAGSTMTRPLDPAFCAAFLPTADRRGVWRTAPGATS